MTFTRVERLRLILACVLSAPLMLIGHSVGVSDWWGVLFVVPVPIAVGCLVVPVFLRYQARDSKAG